jgi:hypothetical protein
MNWVVYLLQVNLALVFCWILYHLAFKQLTFFQWNRFYLLGSVVLSFLLPLIKLQLVHPMEAAADRSGIDWTYVDHLVTQPVALPASSGHLVPGSLLLAFYLLLVFAFFMLAVYRNRQLVAAISKARMVRNGKVKVYVQEGETGSFTLFRRIYLNKTAFDQGAEPVLKHEMVHATQLHSLDLLLMEFAVIFLWFNPFVFLLWRHIRDNHEYLADEGASDRRTSLVEYLSCLKAETIRQYSPAIASSFKCSTIKKRIIMLTNTRSNRNRKWRYLGILPLLVLLLTLFHSTPELSVAGPALDAESISLTPFNKKSNIPSLFPLPEKFREKVTWGYNKEAIHPITKKLSVHQGVDVAAPEGTPVFAAATGKVRLAEEKGGWGKLIILEHSDGFSTHYAHLDGYEVKEGDQVTKGQVIGKVGNTGQSTGPHLHYEVRKEGTHLNPADYY